MPSRNKFILFLALSLSFSSHAFEEGFAVNGDVKIAYRDYGPANAEPILLITGLGAQLTLWPEFLIQDLQDNNFRPIAFDNRDVGLSSRFTTKPSQLLNYLKYFLFLPVKSEYSIEDMGEDGVAVLDQLGIDQSHILGMSMGGMLAQVLVANYPERTKTLTMISSMVSTPNPLNGPKFKVTRQLLKRSANKNDVEGRIDQSIKLFELIGRPGLTPTLIIHGDMDPLIKVKNAYVMHELIQESDLVIVNGMGHLLDTTSYGEFKSDLLNFLNQ